MIILAFALSICVSTLAYGCSDPYLNTNDASNISYNSAALNGNLTDNGGCSPIEVYFQYGKTTSYGNETSHNSYSGTGSFLANISGLDACSTYHFRAVAKNADRTNYGSDKILNTNCYNSPSVDLKANGSDGPVTITYNNFANLSWTSSNANSCTASGDWSGSKSISGSESTGNITASKYYTITCSGSSGGAVVSDSVWVTISSGGVSGNLFFEKLSRNVTDGGAFSNLIYADPGELVSFSMKVRAEGSNLTNVILTDTLPSRLIYQANSLKVNGANVSGNIFSGLVLGDLYSGQEKTITFNALVASADKFSYGQTQLVNVALASGLNNSNSKSATIIVNRTAVAGAATGVSTGITDNLLLDSFFLPLSFALAIIWLFKSYIIRVQDWFYLKRKNYQQYSSQKILELKIAEIKAKEFLKNK